MDLDFTDEQEALRASVRELLARECPPRVLRTLAESGTYPDELWKRMVDLDWPLLTVPEHLGGVGYGFVELAVVAEELGRVAAPSPFEAVATQYQPLLIALGVPLTPRATGTVAFTGDVVVTTGARLQGTARWVFDADAVDELLVITTIDGALAVARVDRSAAGVTITPLPSFDPSRRVGAITFDDAPAQIVGTPGPDTEAAVRSTVDAATAVIAIETVGTGQTLFDLVLDYAKVREQFGVPIGSFQAIKHKLADMFVLLERARATAYYAAAAVAEGDERASLAVSMAKVAAGDAQRLIAQEAIQIHGGIGYTWEHDVHLFVKRAKGGDALFGTAADHRQRIAAALLAPVD